MENTAADTLKKTARLGRLAWKCTSGLIAIPMGIAFLSTGMLLPAVMGALAVYTGIRQVYDAGNEFMTGKKPAPPVSGIEKSFRALEHLNLAVMGLGAFWAGGFAMGLGSTERSMAWLMAGGAGLAASGSMGIGVQVVRGLRRLLSSGSPATEASTPAPAADNSPAPALTNKASTPSFNQSATPDATAQNTPVDEVPRAGASKAPKI